MVQERQIDPVTLAYHEIRSPLGLIVTSARLAAEEAADAAVRDRCAAIERTGERLLRIVALAFALERAPVERERFRPGSTVEAVVDDARRLGANARFSLKPGASAAEVEGLPAHFEMLVQALLSNALDHSEPGYVVLVSASTSGECFDLTVANRAAKQDSHEGLGLGAYLIRRLAAASGASLEESRRGCLHRVHVRLPLAESLPSRRAMRGTRPQRLQQEAAPAFSR